MSVNPPEESLTSSCPVASVLHADTGGVADAPARSAGASVALPGQDSDNCIGKEKYQKPSTSSLTPSRKKIRHKMMMGIEWMIRKHGIERVGVLTLSFGVPGSGKGSFETWALRQQAKEWDFVQNRWHSFCTNVVAKRYPDWVCAFELHRDRVWHLHVPVATKEDIRTGTNIEVLSNYSLPYWMRRGKHLRNEALAAEWKSLRVICCKYRFGRVELLPVKKSAEAVANYLGDYLTKTYILIPPGQRRRLVRFSKCINQAILNKFSIHSLGQLIYRTRLKMAASMLYFNDYGDFADYFGARWNYYLRDIIASIPIPMRFAKGQFESGVAAKLLNDFAENPLPYLDEASRKKLTAVQSALLQKFTDLAFDETTDGRWPEADNLDVGPVTDADLHDDFFEKLKNPF
jgi:hypothetical protein